MKYIKKAKITCFGIDDELKNDSSSIYTTQINSSKFKVPNPEVIPTINNIPSTTSNYLQFNSSATLYLEETLNCDILLVGGGGSGGTRGGGGGGAGAVIYSSNQKLYPALYNINIGSGGSAVIGGTFIGDKGNNGNDTSIIKNNTTTLYLAKGGGGGANNDYYLINTNQTIAIPKEATVIYNYTDTTIIRPDTYNVSFSSSGIAIGSLIPNKSYPIIKNEIININRTPNLWCRFETGALLTNSGTDTITLTNNNLVINSGVSVRGNNSASFNGTNQNLSGNIVGITNNSFSVSTWMYSKTGTTAKGIILTIGTQNISFQKIIMGFGISNANRYCLSFWAEDSYSSAYPDDINKWVHITFVYNSLNKEKMIYRNGIKITSSISSSQPIPNNNLKIGSLDNNAFGYNGYLDDLRIYTGTVLTQEEITRIYIGSKNETIGTNLSPVLWYKFDDPDNIGLDSMGNANLQIVSGTVLPYYDNTISVRGNGSAKSVAGQNKGRINYNFSDIIDQFTICFWININLLRASEDMVFTGSTPLNFYLTRNGIGSNYKIYMFGNTTAFLTLNGAWVADNKWRHIIITAEKSGTQTKLTSYLNGEFNGTQTSGTWVSNSGVSWIQLYGYNLTFQGNLDDLRFYNKVLTQEQITELYNGRIELYLNPLSIINNNNGIQGLKGASSGGSTGNNSSLDVYNSENEPDGIYGTKGGSGTVGNYLLSYAGGGGGGANSNLYYSENALFINNSNVIGGNGHDGININITGINSNYGGGGGGGINTNAITAGIGGIGGGGAGSKGIITATSGTANTGSGGGGGGFDDITNATSGAGGSGIVIIRYDNSVILPILTGIKAVNFTERKNTKRFKFTLNDSIKRIKLSKNAKLAIESITIPNIISNSFVQSKSCNNIILKMKGISSTNIWDSTNNGSVIIFSSPININTQGNGVNTGLIKTMELSSTQYSRFNTNNNGILFTNPKAKYLYNFSINEDFINNGILEFELIYDISNTWKNETLANQYTYIPQTLDYQNDKNNLEGFMISFVILDEEEDNEIYNERKLLNKINKLLLYNKEIYN